MKKQFIILGLLTSSIATITSCSKASFDDYYRNPSKITETSIEKQYTGVTMGFKELIIPTYRNLFVTLRPTINRYIQTLGWINEANQLTVGAAATTDRWEQYYKGLAQFKDLENIYSKLSQEEQLEKRIFLITSKVLFYDQTQQMVDLFGDIPWSEAGKLNANGGDYAISYPKYDSAEDIYKIMLDDLKSINTELSTLTVPNNVTNSFRTQDLINNGNLDLWRKYCNGLRLRLLTRVSESTTFSARATSEIAEIVNNPTTSPLGLTNQDNADIKIFDSGSKVSSDGIRDAFEAEGTWYANLAGKLMIDNMNLNVDPRQAFIFEPGVKANNVFVGLDPALGSVDQTDLARGGTISIYNRSTFSRNKFFPGILMTATEVNLLLAEYYVKNSNAQAAKTSFENAVKESIDLYVYIRSNSDDNTVAAANTPTTTEVNNYLTNINWDGSSNKIELIANQKWIHFNLVQAVEAWSEVRRLDYPKFNVLTQTSDLFRTIPERYTIPANEQTYNSTNYEKVKNQDVQTNKIFWDVR